MSDNEQRESAHFKFFRQLVDDFPEGEVEHVDEPDFLIHSPSGIVGVEHTQLFKPNKSDKPPTQAFESQAEEIVALAQEHAELRATPPVNAALFFNLRNTLPKARRLELARAIARVIHDNVPQQNESIQLEYRPGGPGEQPPEVDLIILSRDEQRKRHYWQTSEAGLVLRDCRHVIQNTIDEKSTKLPKYLAKCAKCWLLMVSDGLRPSGKIFPDDKSAVHCYESRFERTYFLDCTNNRLHLLKSEN